VIPWGPTLCDEQVDISQAEKLVASLGIDRGFLLHFGSAEERKDTRGVIAAWAMVRKRYRQNWRLLIVGLDDTARAEFGSLAQMLGVADETRLCGFVPERELRVLMSCASVLVYPSKAEGFGLPVLEAFASATPVITSDTSSLPEVAGDAASLVPPGRPTALASAMTALMKDPMRRAELAGRGTKRLEQFTWERAADHFARVCEAITKPRKRRKQAA
jgi:glycosyltransferase involved in cell wall biosynthesis